MKVKSIILVVVQMTAIVILCATASPICDKPVLLIIQGISLALLAWTWFNLVPGKFNIVPDAKKDAKLVKTGPFRFIRHPMYLSLFIYLVPLVVNYFSWVRLSVLIIFTVNMVIKLLYEEKLLQKKFADYTDYMKHSYRLIPFIF
jgi:protein-S-isoprenylcysteine O-methyltransferase Ste14